MNSENPGNFRDRKIGILLCFTELRILSTLDLRLPDLDVKALFQLVGRSAYKASAHGVHLVTSVPCIAYDGAA